MGGGPFSWPAACTSTAATAAIRQATETRSRDADDSNDTFDRYDGDGVAAGCSRFRGRQTDALDRPATSTTTTPTATTPTSTPPVDPHQQRGPRLHAYSGHAYILMPTPVTTVPPSAPTAAPLTACDGNTNNCKSCVSCMVTRSAVPSGPPKQGDLRTPPRYPRPLHDSASGRKTVSTWTRAQVVPLASGRDPKWKRPYIMLAYITAETLTTAAIYVLCLLLRPLPRVRAPAAAPPRRDTPRPHRASQQSRGGRPGSWRSDPTHTTRHSGHCRDTSSDRCKLEPRRRRQRGHPRPSRRRRRPRARR